MLDLLATHERLLSRWRQSMNLVGPGAVDLHYEDCRRAIHWLEPTGRWADLGSGAGFPGVVFASLFPTVALDLVDSRSKRCAFLDAVLGEAGVPATRVRVLQKRVETLPDRSYSGILARAFAPPPVVLEHGRRLLEPGGTAVLFLQADTPLPDARDYEVFHVEHYTVADRARRAVGLRFSVSPLDGDPATAPPH